MDRTSLAQLAFLVVSAFSPFAPAAANAVTPAEDQEEPGAPAPRAGAAPAGHRSTGEPATEPVRPRVGSGINFRFGFAGGGETLATAGPSRVLTSGGGGGASLGAMLTPVWLGDDAVGLGAGLEIGWFGQSITGTDGSLSFSRFPFLVTAHLIGRLSDRWSLGLNAGTRKDLGAHLSGEGAAASSFDLQSTWGATLGLGLIYSLTTHVSVDVTLRGTLISYRAPGGELDGNSVGFFMGIQFNP